MLDDADAYGRARQQFKEHTGFEIELLFKEGGHGPPQTAADLLGGVRAEPDRAGQRFPHAVRGCRETRETKGVLGGVPRGTHGWKSRVSQKT